MKQKRLAEDKKYINEMAPAHPMHKAKLHVPESGDVNRTFILVSRGENESTGK